MIIYRFYDEIFKSNPKVSNLFISIIKIIRNDISSVDSLNKQDRGI
jgi:hemoglobin-like flavoprotein